MKKSQMKYRVMAGNMFCGTLTITSSGVHIFRTRAGNLVNPERIMSYKKVSLERVN